MPPKLKFTRERLIEKAFEIVQKGGWKDLSTRSLAAELGSSPMPIYSCFNSIQELEPEIIKLIIVHQHAAMMREFTGDSWHDHGIGYVVFAMEERRLFLSINDESHLEQGRRYGQRIWDDCTRILSGYPPFRGLSETQVYDIQLKRWMLAHGLAFHACFAPAGTIGMERVVQHIREGSNAILNGMKLQFMP